MRAVCLSILDSIQTKRQNGRAFFFSLHPFFFVLFLENNLFFFSFDWAYTRLSCLHGFKKKTKMLQARNAWETHSVSHPLAFHCKTGGKNECIQPPAEHGSYFSPWLSCSSSIPPERKKKPFFWTSKCYINDIPKITHLFFSSDPIV